MRSEEWVFADRTHPVYQRGPDEDRWIAPMPGMTPARYSVWETPASGRNQLLEAEPLRMEMEGFPSTTLYRAESGDTLQKVTLRSDKAPDIELRALECFAEDWLKHLRSMSLGGYSQRMLRAMQHPYGFGVPAAGKRAAEPVSWERLTRPRRIPPMGRQAYRPRMRGRVADHAIVNLQSGAFWLSWYLRVLRWYGGVTLLFGNRAAYSWFLAHGTTKMQAHGPWETVARRLLPGLFQLWRTLAQQAWRKGLARAENEVAAVEGQFGEGAAMAPAVAAEIGGFS